MPPDSPCTATPLILTLYHHHRPQGGISIPIHCGPSVLTKSVKRWASQTPTTVNIKRDPVELIDQHLFPTHFILSVEVNQTTVARRKSIFHGQRSPDDLIVRDEIQRLIGSGPMIKANNAPLSATQQDKARECENSRVQQRSRRFGFEFHKCLPRMCRVREEISVLSAPLLSKPLTFVPM
jgi:hypothetical protein